MALTQTTLNGAITSTQTTLTITSGTPLNGQFLLIDSEYIQVQDNTNAPTLKVQRGLQGSLAKAHDTLAPVEWGNASDFPINQSNIPGNASYGQAGAITIPATNTFIELCSGAASAMTLANPTIAQDGLTLVIMARDAQAYTVVNTSGFNGGGSGTDTATFGGAIGDNFTIVASNGKWNVRYLRNVTLG